MVYFGFLVFSFLPLLRLRIICPLSSLCRTLPVCAIVVCDLRNFCQTFFSLLFLLPLLRLKIPADNIFSYDIERGDDQLFTLAQIPLVQGGRPILRALYIFIEKIITVICIDEHIFVKKINFGNCLKENRLVSCWLCRHLPENNCSSIICFTLEHPCWCFAFLIWKIYLNLKWNKSKILRIILPFTEY